MQIEKNFDCRLKTFLKAIKDGEDTVIQQGRLKKHQQLSGPVQQSWESRGFWIIYAVLHSFAFDKVYWQKIDPWLLDQLRAQRERGKRDLTCWIRRER